MTNLKNQILFKYLLLSNKLYKMNKIAIIGCGNMGLIYANSFLKYKITSKENLLLVEKNKDRQLSLSSMNIGTVVTASDQLITDCDIVILAVKPQDFKELAESLKQVVNPNCVLLSIIPLVLIVLFLSNRCIPTSLTHFSNRSSCRLRIVSYRILRS